MCLSGLSANEARAKPYIASMGIYVFKKELLVKLLKEKYTKSNDFGGEIIPAAAADHKVTSLQKFFWRHVLSELELLHTYASVNAESGGFVQVVAYLFNDYWEDIGTIKSFFEANLALAQQVNVSTVRLNGLQQ